MATIIRPTYLPRQEKEDNWLMKALVQGLTNYALDQSARDDTFEKNKELARLEDERKIKNAEVFENYPNSYSEILFSH